MHPYNGMSYLFCVLLKSVHQKSGQNDKDKDKTVEQVDLERCLKECWRNYCLICIFGPTERETNWPTRGCCTMTCRSEACRTKHTHRHHSLLLFFYKTHS